MNIDRATHTIVFVCFKKEVSTSDYVGIIRRAVPRSLSVRVTNQECTAGFAVRIEDYDNAMKALQACPEIESAEESRWRYSI
jgi:hypothetical protein